MKLYAESGGRFAAQFLADALAVAWIAAWAWAGTEMHRIVLRLAEPGRTLEAAGGDFSAMMNDAAAGAAEIPFAGESLSAPFTGAGEAGGSVAEAGRQFQDTVADVALALGLTTALLPILLVLAVWLPLRVLWIRKASAAHGLRRDGVELLALRALTERPLRQLRKVSDDPAGAWRDGDPEVIRRLAELQLRRLGLRA
ncbi:hypothetical protein [Allonocardiopsis opalescens]|uniref:Transmembrane protein n=1 Tax=Allonocardiopsis opalescens TaxID=1144618 RepID=A0A2T0Q064_9ACTN|nr:hypothetical protein [Allonocardiopsis opalescens]PRX97174.1 hypothetical protein CLV72_106210 [Allonocardiopsis opalescens]